jgi:hypothetical protein
MNRPYVQQTEKPQINYVRSSKSQEGSFSCSTLLGKVIHLNLQYCGDGLFNAFVDTKVSIIGSAGQKGGESSSGKYFESDS